MPLEAGPATIEDWELTESFTTARGPGGQNVNKVATAVELRFEAARSPHLPEPVKSRLRAARGAALDGRGAGADPRRGHPQPDPQPRDRGGRGWRR